MELKAELPQNSPDKFEDIHVKYHDNTENVKKIIWGVCLKHFITLKYLLFSRIFGNCRDDLVIPASSQKLSKIKRLPTKFLVDFSILFLKISGSVSVIKTAQKPTF